MSAQLWAGLGTFDRLDETRYNPAFYRPCSCLRNCRRLMGRGRNHPGGFGLPSPLTIRNHPIAIRVTAEGALIIPAPGKTNLFNSPGGGTPTDTAPMAFFKPEGDFVLTAKVSAPLKAVYDVAALVIYENANSWAKFCYEFSPEKSRPSFQWRPEGPPTIATRRASRRISSISGSPAKARSTRFTHRLTERPGPSCAISAWPPRSRFRSASPRMGRWETEPSPTFITLRERPPGCGHFGPELTPNPALSSCLASCQTSSAHKLGHVSLLSPPEACRNQPHYQGDLCYKTVLTGHWLHHHQCHRRCANVGRDRRILPSRVSPLLTA